MAQVSYKRTTPRCVFKIDPTKHPWEQEKKLHNRWHPDIPHVRSHSTPPMLGFAMDLSLYIVFEHRLQCTVGWTAATMAAMHGLACRAGTALDCLTSDSDFLCKQLFTSVRAV